MITDPAALAELQADMMTSGVMSRRVIAWLIDCVLIGMIGTAVFSFCAFIGLVTFGLGAGAFGARAHSLEVDQTCRRRA